MVWPVNKKTDIKAENTADSAESVNETGQPVTGFQTPEPRFPQAAVTFVDALLDIQRQRFDRERAVSQSTTPTDENDLRNHVTLAASAHFMADGDNFIGTGWSDLGHRRDGTAFRWMGRIGTLLVPIDLTEGATITIKGCGYTKKKFLKDMTLWIDDQQIVGEMARKGFNSWVFRGAVPPMKWRPYSVLRIQSAGQARLAVGIDTYASVAVSELQIEAGKS